VKATGRALNPRPVNRKSNALPLSHHATPYRVRHHANLKAVSHRITQRTVHTEAGEATAVVETRALVLTRVGRALVDVRLAPVAGVSGYAGAPERAGSINARAAVLAWRPPTCNNRYVTLDDVILSRDRLCDENERRLESI